MHKDPLAAQRAAAGSRLEAGMTEEEPPLVSGYQATPNNRDCGKPHFDKACALDLSRKTL
jgi:hypothetical protein